MLTHWAASKVKKLQDVAQREMWIGSDVGPDWPACLQKAGLSSSARRPVNSHWDISWFKQTNVSESARRRRLYSQMLNGTIARFTSLPWNERNTVPLSKITTLIWTLTHPRCLERVHLGWQRSVLNASWAAYTASWKAAATRLWENLNYHLNASVTYRITRGPPQRSEPQQNSGVIISILIPAT